MAENESNESNVAERLKKLTATRDATTRRAPKKKLPVWIIPACSGVICLVAGAAMVILVSDIEQESEPSPLKTSAAPGLSGATGLEGMRIAKPAIAPEPVPDSEEVQLLRAMVNDLEGKLQELRDNPEQVMVADDTALQELKAELSKMKDAVAAKDAHAQALEMDVSRLETKIETDALLAEQQSANAETERRQQEEEEQRRAEALALEQEKINSPILGMSRDGESGGDVAAATDRYRGDEAFIRAGAKSSDVTRSQVIANPGNTVPQGTLIEAALQTGINSDLAGNVTAVVSYDVWSFDMSNVLIPRGSKLFGRYSSDVKTGQNRLLVAWDRLTTPDGQSVLLDAYGADRLGRSGLSGDIDHHFLSRFGTAALISIIGALPGTITKDDDKSDSDVAKNVADDFSGAVDDVISETLRRPPTLTIEHGAIVTVIVNTDLELF